MLARVVTFDGVTKERMDEMRSEMEGGDPPEGLNPKEMIALHDPESDKVARHRSSSRTRTTYRRGDEVLSAMPTDDTPGQRTSVGALRRRDAPDDVERRGAPPERRRPVVRVTRPGSPRRPGRGRR